ncbi:MULTISPECIES: hypothetical protein [unclassified Moraxella]|uniref:hypothetical protein n=1 Tax=unclassified Moraxella TaxID=2685852 RepID=UPI003AF9FE3D
MKKLLLLATLSAICSSAIAVTSPKLPFVGEAEFNFNGGTINNRLMTIKKNGNVTIIGENFEHKPFTVYKGKYQNFMWSKEDDTFYHITSDGNYIEMYNKSKKLEQGCLSNNGDETVCRVSLTK